MNSTAVRRIVSRGLPLLLLLSLNVHAATALPLTIFKLAEPAELLRDGERLSLKTGGVVAAGDELTTGPEGRASLRYNELAMTLGGDSELRYAGDAALNNVGGPVLRLQLVSGTLRVDGRTGRNAPQDLRLNVADLRLRVLGADVWVAAAEEQRTVCLLEGAVEVQSERGSRRLDTEGDCLFADGNDWRVDHLSSLALLGRLSLTDYPATGGPGKSIRLSSNIAAAPAPSEAAPIDVDPVRAPPPPPAPAVQTPPPAVPEPVLVAQAQLPPANNGPERGGWTLVALALADGESAKLEAMTFSEIGLPTVVRPAVAPNGKPFYRVTIGSFATRKQAQAYNDLLKAQLGLNQLWIAPY